MQLKKIMLSGLISCTLIMTSCASSSKHTYPSMDMSAVDTKALVYVVANTPGNIADKKDAVFYILDQVWYDNPANLSISEIVYRAYDGYTQPDEEDFALVHEIILNNGKD